MGACRLRRELMCVALEDNARQSASQAANQPASILHPYPGHILSQLSKQSNYLYFWLSISLVRFFRVFHRRVYLSPQLEIKVTHRKELHNKNVQATQNVPGYSSGQDIHAVYDRKTKARSDFGLKVVFIVFPALGFMCHSGVVLLYVVVSCRRRLFCCGHKQQGLLISTLSAAVERREVVALVVGRTMRRQMCLNGRVVDATKNSTKTKIARRKNAKRKPQTGKWLPLLKDITSFLGPLASAHMLPFCMHRKRRL